MIKRLVMVGCTVVKKLINRWKLLTVGITISLYVVSNYLRPPLQAHLTKFDDYHFAGDSSIVTRYHDSKNGSVVEHVLFKVPLHDGSQETIMRRGILLRRPQAKATILMCHGLGCSKQDIALLRMLFTEYNIMLFDFRAHGQDSFGQYCTLGRDEMLDVLAAAQVIKNHEKIKHIPLLVYAFSMGAVSAIEAQARQPDLFKGMILDCPFDSVEKLIRRGLDEMKISFLGYEVPLPGKKLLERCAFNRYTQPVVQAVLRFVSSLDAHGLNIMVHEVKPEKTVKKVEVPCFFIHCKNDEKVPVASIKKVFENTGSRYKHLWITGGRKHFDSFFHEPERYVRKVQRFVSRVINDNYDALPQGKITDDSMHPRAEVF
ncbi:alpha/beta hydrolase [Candidatus Dependentiae bacterium]|nr:alpha/beta hydrolase [Candidatus Dependentiae bacterium]